MSIVGGVDIHRKQVTFDYVEVETGRLERGRISRRIGSIWPAGCPASTR
jgi:hypothetical protein